MLTQLTTLKARLNITTTGDDATLTGLANGVHGVFDRFCNRQFARTEGAEFTLIGSVAEVCLPCYPVEAILSVTQRENSRAVWRQASGVQWLIDFGSGVLSIVSGAIGSESAQTRIVYTGGYVLPGSTPMDGQLALPAEVEEAAIAQTIHQYETRHLHMSAATGGTAAKTARDVELLPQVEMTLQMFRRITF